MNESLLWRIEYNDKGPLSSNSNFEAIYQAILKLGPTDGLGTTFLNIYDQSHPSPRRSKVFSRFIEKIESEKNLRFAFRTKNDLEEAFHIKEEHLQINTMWYQQFARLLNQDPLFSVKVYLGSFICEEKGQILFDINKATLIDVFHDIESFHAA